MQRRKREAGKEFRTLGGWLLERARVRGMRWVSPRLMAGSFLVPGLLSMTTPADPAAPGCEEQPSFVLKGSSRFSLV